MTKDEMIARLNGDLRNEYKHMHFYLQSSFLVRGLHREELSEYLADHAKSEFEHVQQFAKVIVGLGGVPDTNPNSFPNLTDPQEILEYALQMEDEVVSNYVQRMKDAQSLGGVDGAYVEIFLEDQILDSRGDADHLREMVKKS
jgi:bacterioferritin (cytochrome b1)